MEILKYDCVKTQYELGNYMSHICQLCIALSDIDHNFLNVFLSAQNMFSLRAGKWDPNVTKFESCS